MGGFYERLVGLVKRAIRKTIQRKLLTVIQLQTILKEVEATVNARPVVYVGDDLESNITLAPQHFLSLNKNIIRSSFKSSRDMSLYRNKPLIQEFQKLKMIETTQTIVRMKAHQEDYCKYGKRDRSY